MTYSTMTYCEFKTYKTVDEAREIIKANGLSDVIGIGTDDDYDEDGKDYYLNFSSNVVEVYPSWGEYYACHDKADNLAKAISLLISSDTYTLLTFTDDDNEKWGYYIKRGVVKEVEWIPFVDGVLLSELE
ncbi:MAG: hypothetical protein QW561_00170 [Candidatus Aenigmatarchaeota archaeon]